jgi:RNA polymerase sigma-70 factor (ECF subfamily)
MVARALREMGLSTNSPRDASLHELRHQVFLTVVGVLFDAHRGHLVRLVKGQLHDQGSAEDAEDVVHVVFSRVLQRGPDAPPIGLSYLLQAARREAWKHFRNAGTRRRRIEEFGRQSGMDASLYADPPARLESADRCKRLSEALSALPDGQRRAFELRWLHGLGLREAAQAAGTTRENMRKQARRAWTRVQEVRSR